MLPLALWALIVCFSLSAATTAKSQVAPDVAAPAAIAQGQVQAQTSTTPAPLVATGLPGSSFARLVSSNDYISPFAAYFSAQRQPTRSDLVDRYYRSRGRLDLSRVPEMFGDYRSAGTVLTVTGLTADAVQSETPSAAGISGVKVAENNHALPRDRFWVAYNHFNDAFDSVTVLGTGASQSASLNRISIGREIEFDRGRSSIELRMAFGSSTTVNGTAASPYRIESDNVGNLSVILKRLLIADSCSAISTGIGVEVPTGSTGSLSFLGRQFEVDPAAVHLVPFLAMTERYDRWFGHAFAQLDIAVGGDELRVSTVAANAQIAPAPLLGIDLGVGYWLTHNPSSGAGIAAIVELHSTTGLGSDDTFTLNDGTATFGVNTPAGVSNDLLNLTAGTVMARSDGWSLRTAVATPLLSERVFDVEAIVQLNRLF